MYDHLTRLLYPGDILMESEYIFSKNGMEGMTVTKDGKLRIIGLNG